MTREDVLQAVDSAFEDWPRPEQVTESIAADAERRLIEADFGSRKRSELTYNECAMLLVDGALLTQNAFFYFLPRIAKAVLFEGGDWILLGLQLDARRAELNLTQTAAVAALRAELDVIDAEMQE